MTPSLADCSFGALREPLAAIAHFVFVSLSVNAVETGNVTAS